MQNSTIYQDTNTPIATLLIVHGMAEHQKRYQDFAKFLSQQGVVVMTFDHLGHGQRVENLQNLGFMGNPNPKQLMIDDILQHAHTLAEQFHPLPHFILGHSMGSFLTRCVLQSHGKQFAGAILMGTSALNPIILPFIPITKLFNKISPQKANQAFANLLNTINNQPFRQETNLQGFNWLNQDPKKVQDYINDPLCGFSFTNNGFYALMSAMYQGVGKQWADHVPKDLPMLFISGEDDPIGNMGKSIPNIVKTLQQQNFVNVSAQQYPKMRHEILHEEGYQLVYQDILQFIKQFC